MVTKLPADVGDVRGADSIPGSKDAWRRAWQPIPELLPRKPHGYRSLAGYSPYGHKESDTTEMT